MQNKLQTYIGFAKKSNSIIFGIDNLEKCKIKVYLVLYSNNISMRSLSYLNKIVEKKKWKIICLKNISLDELLNTSNCKVIGITNLNLVNAIENELNKN